MMMRVLPSFDQWNRSKSEGYLRIILRHISSSMLWRYSSYNSAAKYSWKKVVAFNGSYRCQISSGAMACNRRSNSSIGGGSSSLRDCPKSLFFDMMRIQRVMVTLHPYEIEQET